MYAPQRKPSRPYVLQYSVVIIAVCYLNVNLSSDCLFEQFTFSNIVKGHRSWMLIVATSAGHYDSLQNLCILITSGLVCHMQTLSTIFTKKLDLHNETPPCIRYPILEEEKGNVTSHMYTIAVDPVGKCSNHSVSARV